MPDPNSDGSTEASEGEDTPPETPGAGGRKRPRPGERRAQILQTLATMLQEPGAERVTTAALAARIQVSEAALYRHFASKAQMFEGLIDFIEQSVFSLVNQIAEREIDGRAQAQARWTAVKQHHEVHVAAVEHGLVCR